MRLAEGPTGLPGSSDEAVPADVNHDRQRRQAMMNAAQIALEVLFVCMSCRVLVRIMPCTCRPGRCWWLFRW